MNAKKQKEMAGPSIEPPTGTVSMQNSVKSVVVWHTFHPWPPLLLYAQGKLDVGKCAKMRKRPANRTGTIP